MDTKQEILDELDELRFNTAMHELSQKDRVTVDRRRFWAVLANRAKLASVMRQVKKNV